MTSYSVSPPLPAGLSLNPSTGVISGTPTTVAAQASYTVTASNSGGSTTAVVSITVAAGSSNPRPPSGLSYPSPPTLAVGAVITPLTPTVTGTVTSYMVAPGLPAGLTLNAGTGVISGTPTTVAGQAGYTVTASNSAGSTSTVVSITVVAAVASVPIITLQPQSANVPVYRPASLTVAATGNGTLSYQWYYASSGGTAITGATSATLALSSSVTMLDGGSYFCVVTNTLNGTTATATSNTAVLMVLTERSTVTLTGESAVLPGSAGHLVSTPAQAGITYVWTITNGSITAGQGTNQVTYTAGSLGHTVVRLTVLTSTGAGVQTQNVAVVGSVPVVSVFAPPSVLPDSSAILASAPAFAGDSYDWTLTSGTATATITSGQSADILTYSVGSSTGTYQAGLTLTDVAGNQASASATLSVVSNTFVPDARDPGPRSLHTATLLNDGRVLIAGGDTGIPDFSTSGVATPIAGSQSLITASAELFDPATRTFAYVGPMATPRFEHTATLLNDGRVLVVGGANSGAAALGSTEIYDPVARTWSAGPSLTTARALHTATLLGDGRVLVAGGVNGSSAVGTAEVYDPVANAWTSAGSLTVARALHSATLMPNGQVLVVGGGTASGIIASVEIYDPVANAWAPTAPVPIAENGNGAVLLPSGRVFLPVEGIAYDPTTATWINASGEGPNPPLTGTVGFNTVLLPDGRVFVSGNFFGTGGLGGIYDPLPQHWSTSPGPNPANNSYSSATVLADGRVLTVGGVQSGSVSAAAAALTDPVAGTVSALGSKAHEGALAAAATLPGSQVLVSGGFVGRDAPGAADVTSAADLYDAATNTWSAAAPLSTPRGGHTATVLADGSVLVVGGYTDQGTVFDSAERYNATNNAWTAASAMANPRYEHTASLLGNGTVLVAGGSNAIVGSCSCTTFLSTAELYNPAANSWSATGSLNVARYGHTATVLQNGQVLVAGGIGGVPNTMQDIAAAQPTTELYDSGTRVWTPAAPMNDARAYHTATLLPSGKVLVTGGTGASGSTLQTAEVYDPVANTWTRVGPLATARESHSAVLLASGDVLVVGGYNTSASTLFGVGTAELYDPVAQTFSSAGSMSTLRQGFTLTAPGTGRTMLVGGLPNLAGLPEFYQ